MSGLRVSSRLHFELCPEVRVRFLGASLDLESKLGSLRRRYETLGERQLEVSTELDLPGGTLVGPDLDAFHRFLDAALAQHRIWFSIENSGDAS